MRIRVRYHHWLPRFLQIGGIVLYPYVLLSTDKAHTPRRVLQHEMVHVRQVRHHGVVRFYSVYLIEYVGHLMRLRNHNAAYLAISFEAEAYSEENRIALTTEELNEMSGKS